MDCSDGNAAEESCIGCSYQDNAMDTSCAEDNLTNCNEGNNTANTPDVHHKPMDWSNDATTDEGFNTMASALQETDLSWMHFGTYPNIASNSSNHTSNTQPLSLHYSSSSFVYMNTTTFFL